MTLTEPPYISMSEAATLLAVTVDRMQWYIQSGQLTAYVEPTAAMRLYNSDPCPNYLPVTQARWDAGTLRGSIGDGEYISRYPITDVFLETTQVHAASISKTKAQENPALAPKAVKSNLDLVKVIVNRASDEIFSETGKTNYSDVLRRVNRFALNDDQVAMLIKSATNKGIVVEHQDEPIAVKTVRNWLSDFNKARRSG